jgi:HK97 family phage major capsid protein
MSNPILDEFDKLQRTLIEEREQNEKRLAAVEHGASTTVAEQDQKLAKLEDVISQSQAKIKELQDEKEKLIARTEMVEALLERPKGTPQEVAEKKYTEVFFKALREGFADPSLNSEMIAVAKEHKDVTIGSNAGGGFALPKQIGSQVDALLLKLSDILNHVKMIQVGTSDYQELVSIHGGTSGWVAETGTRSATGTPNLRSQKPTWGELYAYPQISEWSAQDIFFNVESWLVNDIAEGMANTLSTAIFSGNGTNKPTGMTNGAPVTTNDHASPLRSAVVYEYIPVSSSPQALGSDDLIDLVYTLNRRYRTNARFAMNTTTQGAVRKLKDTTNQYLWQPSIQLGQPDMLLGYPVFTWEDLADPTTADGYPVAFGDFNRGYLLTFRTDLAIQAESVTNPGYVRFYVRRRYGGYPLNNDAVKFIKLADS